MACGLMNQIPLSSSRPALPGERKNRRRPPWESLALTTTRRVRPTLDQLLESTNVMVLPLGCSQPPVSHSSPDMGLWFDNLAKGRTGRGKITEDHILSQCSLLFPFTFLHLEPTRHFICMTFLHLSFYLPFKVASQPSRSSSCLPSLLHWLTLFLQVCERFDIHRVEGLRVIPKVTEWRYDERCVTLCLSSTLWLRLQHLSSCNADRGLWPFAFYFMIICFITLCFHYILASQPVAAGWRDKAFW